MSFSRTQRYIAQFRNQSGSQQLCDCLLVPSSTELHRRLLYDSVKCPSQAHKSKQQHTTTAYNSKSKVASSMPSVGIELATLQLLFDALTN